MQEGAKIEVKKTKTQKQREMVEADYSQMKDDSNETGHVYSWGLNFSSQLGHKPSKTAKQVKGRGSSGEVEMLPKKVGSLSQI